MMTVNLVSEPAAVEFALRFKDGTVSVSVSDIKEAQRMQRRFWFNQGKSSVIVTRNVVVVATDWALVAQ